jgi:hypothetical protein
LALFAFGSNLECWIHERGQVLYIISDFRDYYDSCAVYGIDKTIRYFRKQRVIERIDRPELGDQKLCGDFSKISARVISRSAQIENDHIQPILIGFCGKIYQCLRLEIDIKTGTLRRDTRFLRESSHDRVASGLSRFEYAWAPKDVAEQDLNLEVCSYMRAFRSRAAKTVSQWFESNKEVMVSDALPLFVDHEVVSFVLNRKSLTINPCLQDLKFQRAITVIFQLKKI